MHTEYELQAFSHWLNQPQQAEAAEPHRMSNMALACARLGMEEDDVFNALSREATVDYALMSMDNCACAGFDETRSLGEVYLKKRGWKDSALNRAYIEAIQTAPLRLYRIVDVEPTRVHLEHAFEPRDAHAVEPIEDYDFVPGDFVATRILVIRGKTRTASGILYFPQEDLDLIVDFLNEARIEMAEASAEEGEMASLPEDLPGFLQNFPFLIVNYWLEALLFVPDEIAHSPVSHLFGNYWRAVYALSDGVSEAEFEQALSALPGLTSSSLGRWKLAELDVEGSAGAFDRPLEHAVVFNDRRLRFYAASGATRDRLRDLFGGLDAQFFDGPPEVEEIQGLEMTKDLLKNLARQPPPG